MTKSTSLFLDGLRVLAALTVFAGHANWLLYGYPVLIPGHAAVVVFFVLSGYVIAYSTLHRREMNAKRYVIARLSRLYSVVIPALILTEFLVFCGKIAHLNGYEHYGFAKIAAMAIFLQSIWSMELSTRTNSPFWSLGYEFWYYAIFGILIFARDWKWKAGLVVVCCLIAGGSILLLLPVWGLGVGIYLWRNKPFLSRKSAWACCAVAAFLIGLCLTVLPEGPDRVGTLPLRFSAAYLSDWTLGLAIALLIWSFDQACATQPVPTPIENSLRWASNHTFSLYLFHFPLIFFVAATGIFNQHLWWHQILETVLILIVIIALSELTESRRKLWQQGITKLWDSIEDTCAALQPNAIK